MKPIRTLLDRNTLLTVAGAAGIAYFVDTRYDTFTDPTLGALFGWSLGHPFIGAATAFLMPSRATVGKWRQPRQVEAAAGTGATGAITGGVKNGTNWDAHYGSLNGGARGPDRDPGGITHQGIRASEGLQREQFAAANRALEHAERLMRAFEGAPGPFVHTGNPAEAALLSVRIAFRRAAAAAAKRGWRIYFNTIGHDRMGLTGAQLSALGQRVQAKWRFQYMEDVLAD